MSSIRLETFSDGVFAIAVTLLALQLRPPNLGGATSAHAVLHALAQQGRQFGFYVLAFLLTGGLWIEHHQLLDPLETHGRRLPRANLWFLLTVSLLPYWVSVLATYPNNSGCPTRWSSAAGPAGRRGSFGRAPVVVPTAAPDRRRVTRAGRAHQLHVGSLRCPKRYLARELLPPLGVQ